MPTACLPFPSSPSAPCQALANVPLPQTGSSTLPDGITVSPSLSLSPIISFRAHSTVGSSVFAACASLPACQPGNWAGSAWLAAVSLVPSILLYSQALENVGPSPALPALTGTTALQPLATMPIACAQQTCSTTACPCITPQVLWGCWGGQDGGLGTPHQACLLQGTSWAWDSVSSTG